MVARLDGGAAGDGGGRARMAAPRRPRLRPLLRPLRRRAGRLGARGARRGPADRPLPGAERTAADGAGEGARRRDRALRGHRAGRKRDAPRRRDRPGVPAAGDAPVSAPHDPAAGSRRRALGPLLAAEAISTTGMAMTALALPWLVLTSTGSPAQEGLLASAGWGAAVLLRVPR